MKHLFLFKTLKDQTESSISFENTPCVIYCEETKKVTYKTMGTFDLYYKADSKTNPDFVDTISHDFNDGFGHIQYSTLFEVVSLSKCNSMKELWIPSFVKIVSSGVEIPAGFILHLTNNVNLSPLRCKQITVVIKNIKLLNDYSNIFGFIGSYNESAVTNLIFDFKDEPKINWADCCYVAGSSKSGGFTYNVYTDVETIKQQFTEFSKKSTHMIVNIYHLDGSKWQ